MGRKVSISQPAVIQTELRPLDESFWIDANGQLEQWYYQNTGAFSPDRQVTPLKLTPHLSVLDPDGNNGQGTTYTPTLALTKWEVKEFIDGAWVTRNITSLSPSDAYSIDTDGLTLIVAKNNYDAAHAINLTCNATYIDPRDEGVTYTVSESTMLLTSVDATQVFPNIDIKNPSSRMFNPLKDNPIYEFEGSADWDVIEGQGDTVITEYKADALGTEKIIPTNEEMLVNAAPLLDIKYGDRYIVDGQGNHISQQFMERQVSGGVVSEIGDGVAKITNIKGNTVKVNQFLNTTFVKYPAANVVIATNGTKCVVTSNIDTTGGDAVMISVQGAEAIVGNKYLVVCEFEIIQGSGITGVSTEGPYPLQNMSNVYGNHWASFVTASGTGYIYLKATGTKHVGDKWSFDKCQMFDLTAMGIDSLTTVAQVEQWLAQNIGLKSYYPYNAGKLINYGGFSVKWNQLCDGITWDGNGATVTIQPNGLCNVKFASNTQRLSFYTRNTGTIPSNHKIYFKMYAVGRKESALVSIKDSAERTYGLSSNGDVIVTNAQEPNRFRFFNNSNVYNTNDEVTIGMCAIDLTLMFGAGNEPDLEWCNKYLSRDYYDYCPSVDKNILDVMETKTGSFNKWDEEWEVGQYNSSTGAKIDGSCVRCANLIPVLPNTAYYFNMPSSVNMRRCYYDKNKTFISSEASLASVTMTTPSNCYYVAFHLGTEYGTTYNHNICINISDSSRNGEYEPYHAQYEKLPMGVKSVGFNVWDEEWVQGTILAGGILSPDSSRIMSKNYIPIFSGRDYYFNIGPIGIAVYDINKIFLGFISDNNNLIQQQTFREAGTWSIPSNGAYIKFVLGQVYGNTYNNDICINLSDPSRNGTYEPHWESFSDMSWITKIGIENFNIWDEEWENGDYDMSTGQPTSGRGIRSKSTSPISVIGGQTYYLRCAAQLASGSAIVLKYGANDNYIGYAGGLPNGTFTVESNCRYIRFVLSTTYGTTYLNDICINKSISAYNGKYLPHGQTMPYFPQGLCNVGNVYDEVKVENGKIKGVVRFGVVNLGELNYTYSATKEFFYARNPFNVNMSEVNIVLPSVCSKYQNAGIIANSDDSVFQNAGDKVFTIHARGGSEPIYLYINDSAYTDPSIFKSAMNGVMLYYELATPYEFEIDYPTKGQFEWYGVNGSGNEVPIDQLPVYSQATQPSGYGQHTSKININALYGESIPVILRVKRYPWSTNVLPPKVTKAISWKLPPVDVQVVSDKGSAVRAQNQSGNFTFSTIVNQQGDIIGEEVKRANMVFDWYYKNGNGSTSQPVSGQTFTVSAATLKNTRPRVGATPSTRVWCEAFVLGAYHLVNGTYVRTKD